MHTVLGEKRERKTSCEGESHPLLPCGGGCKANGENPEVELGLCGSKIGRDSQSRWSILSQDVETRKCQMYLDHGGVTSLGWSLKKDVGFQGGEEN